MGKSNTDHFSKESGYIWSMIGSAVGFANILGFSSQCYFHGGGAFLVPFLTALFILGVPLLLLEGVVGQRFSLPLVSAYGRTIGTKGRFLGWLAVIACLTIGAFYTVLTGWSIAYAYFSGAGMIPSDAGTFFKHTFLRDSGSLIAFGGFSLSEFFFTALVMIFSWFVISRNIQTGIERTCSFFLPLLAVLMVIFAVSVCFLPGASTGFAYYLKPDFEKLWNPKLWRDSFGHLFFSLSLGLGIVTGYSRHTTQSMSIPRSMFYVALGDTLISVVSGFAIFGCIGYMSHISGAAFSEMVKPDSIFEIGFVVFPTILKTLGMLERFLGPLFFFCVFIAGVTGVFSIIESVVGNIEIEFGWSRQKAVTLASLLIFLFSALFCFGNGQHIIGALGPMVLGFNMLLGGIAEIIVFMFFSKVIGSDSMWFGRDKPTYAYYLLRYVVPFILAAILFASIKAEIQSGFAAPELLRWGWFALASIVSLALSYNAKSRFFT